MLSHTLSCPVPSPWDTIPGPVKPEVSSPSPCRVLWLSCVGSWGVWADALAEQVELLLGDCSGGTGGVAGDNVVPDFPLSGRVLGPGHKVQVGSV